MADIACQRAGIQTSIQIDERLREIDYGPDENQTEDTVIARIGENAIKLWDQSAIVPEGWNVNPDQMISDWADIAGETLKNHKGKTILIVTSNGVARFAPHLTGQFDAFRQQHNLKLATGALGTLVHDGKGWSVENWNLRPKDHI
jgi:probable phosphoglycerate mutase